MQNDFYLRRREEGVVHCAAPAGNPLAERIPIVADGRFPTGTRRFRRNVVPGTTNADVRAYIPAAGCWEAGRQPCISRARTEWPTRWRMERFVVQDRRRYFIVGQRVTARPADRRRRPLFAVLLSLRSTPPRSELKTERMTATKMTAAQGGFSPFGIGCRCLCAPAPWLGLPAYFWLVSLNCTQMDYTRAYTHGPIVYNGLERT